MRHNHYTVKLVHFIDTHAQMHTGKRIVVSCCLLKSWRRMRERERESCVGNLVTPKGVLQVSQILKIESLWRPPPHSLSRSLQSRNSFSFLFPWFLLKKLWEMFVYSLSDVAAIESLRTIPNQKQTLFFKKVGENSAVSAVSRTRESPKKNKK